MKSKIAVLGCGNIGGAIARGLVNSQNYKAKDVYLTRRNLNALTSWQEEGFAAGTDNVEAVKKSAAIIICVTPHQLNDLLSEIKEYLLPGKHVVYSVVSGVSIHQIKNKINLKVPVLRVMPNTAVAIQESMTCISGDKKDINYLETAVKIFNSLGKTIVIEEELMIPATALCACGIAFFLRAVRAASQGGIEIGFHSEDALFMAAQTAKGAAAMLLNKGHHPESEVDKVTTPQGCTISGLNQMEHSGFSSSLIKGIVTSAEKAETLYSDKK